MVWTVWACDTVTGDKLQRLPVSAFPWARVLCAGGSGSATIPLSDVNVKKLDIEALTMETDITLALDRDGTLRYAGIITGQPTYDYAANSLQVAHADLWWMLARRLAADYTVADTAAATRVYTNLSRGTIAKRQVQLGITGPSNDNASLPITFPADQSDTTGTRKFYGYRFAMVTQVLTELMSEDGGPDIDFQPRWVNNKLDWLMRVGTVASPRLTGSTWEWNLTAKKPGITGLTIARDANKMVTASYGLGEGQGADGLYRSNRIVNPSHPTLHRVEDYSEVTEATVLEGIVNADLALYKNPTEQWSASIRADGTPSVNDLQLGDTGKFWTKGMYRVPDGPNLRRLVQFSGDLTDNIKLEFQTIGGV